MAVVLSASNGLVQRRAFVSSGQNRSNVPCLRVSMPSQALRPTRDALTRVHRISASSSPAATSPASPVDEKAVLDSVIVGAGISGLTTALVRA